MLNTGMEDLPNKIVMMMDTEADLREKIESVQQKTSQSEFMGKLSQVKQVKGIPVLVTSVVEASIDSTAANDRCIPG